MWTLLPHEWWLLWYFISRELQIHGHKRNKPVEQIYQNRSSSKQKQLTTGEETHATWHKYLCENIFQFASKIFAPNAYGVNFYRWTRLTTQNQNSTKWLTWKLTSYIYTVEKKWKAFSNLYHNFEKSPCQKCTKNVIFLKIRSLRNYYLSLYGKCFFVEKPQKFLSTM